MIGEGKHGDSYYAPNIDRATFERLYRRFVNECESEGTTFEDFKFAYGFESESGFIARERHDREDAAEGLS